MLVEALPLPPDTLPTIAISNIFCNSRVGDEFADFLSSMLIYTGTQK